MSFHRFLGTLNPLLSSKCIWSPSSLSPLGGHQAYAGEGSIGISALFFWDIDLIPWLTINICVSNYFILEKCGTFLNRIGRMRPNAALTQAFLYTCVNIKKNIFFEAVFWRPLISKMSHFLSNMKEWGRQKGPLPTCAWRPPAAKYDFRCSLWVQWQQKPMKRHVNFVV